MPVTVTLLPPQFEFLSGMRQNGCSSRGITQVQHLLVEIDGVAPGLDGLYHVVEVCCDVDCRDDQWTGRLHRSDMGLRTALSYVRCGLINVEHGSAEVGPGARCENGCGGIFLLKHGVEADGGDSAHGLD